jgi:pilus assembly protein CpaE
MSSSAFGSASGAVPSTQPAGIGAGTAITQAADLPRGPAKRPKFIGFVADEASAKTLNTAFAPIFPHGGSFHIVSFRTTLSILSRMVTPEILLVDLTGEEQHLNALMDLAEVVEPGTTVLMIGESRDLSFYRAAVNGMGVAEYLTKPLNQASIAKHFLAHLGTVPPSEDVRRGGRLIAVTGVRGGVGTSTIATNLAWSVGHDAHRHAVLLDADLQSGTTSLSLGIAPTRGLLTALETPERIDNMLLERVTQPAGDRLHLLAAQEQFSQDIKYTPGSAAVLTKALRQRYNFVIADAGARHLPFARELLHLAQQRVIILDPTILAIRNLERLNQLPANPTQTPKPILVLNQAGRGFAMSQDFMEEKLGTKFDVVIPDLSRLISKADQYGDMAASIRGPFRNAILRLGKLLGADLAADEKPLATAAA